ncbi:MAG: carboxylesterase family protein, partial [Planctomycetota bacterium]
MTSVRPPLAAAVLLLLTLVGCGDQLPESPALRGGEPFPALVPAENPTPLSWRLSGPHRVGTEAPPEDAHWIGAEARGDLVDLARHLGGEGDRVGFASATLRFKRETTAYIMFAATGPKRAWLDGRLVYRQENERGTFDKRDSVFPVRFRKGENRLLLAVGSGERGWAFSVSLADPWEAWMRVRGYARSPLKISASAVKGDALRLKVRLSGGPKDPPAGKGILHVLRDGAVIAERDLEPGVPVDVRFPAAGLYRLEAWARYDRPAVAIGGREFCGTACMALGDVDDQVRRLRARILKWLDGRGGRDLRHRGCVLFFAETAFGRGWRERGGEPVLKNPDFAVRLDELLDGLERGRDVLASRRGTFLWGLYSRTCDDGQPLPISLPPNYNPEQAYPLVIFLHGSGGSWNKECFRSAPSAEPYIQIAGDWRGPECRNYSGLAERDVLDAIDFVKANFSVDPDRVHLFGHSIGGYASWRFGSLYADRFAAVAPFAGMRQGYPLGNLINLPLKAFHGEKDPACHPRSATSPVTQLRKLGARASFRIYPGGKHWVYGAPGDAVRWMLRQPPRKTPDSVDHSTRWVTRGRGRSYWAEILEMSDAHAWARVKLTAKADRVTGTTHNVRVLRLALPELFASRREAILAINGREIRVRSAAPVVLKLDAQGVPRPSGRADLPREPIYSEGSIQNLFDGKPVRIVIPSGGDEAYRAAVAKRAARMAKWAGKYGGLPVLCDSDVSAAKPNAHL